MTARLPNAIFMSAALHALVIALILLMALYHPQPEPPRKIFELVAGRGDNYKATVAPALGTPGGLKFKAPEMPATKPEPAPEAPTPAPEKAVAPAPPTKAAPPKTAPVIPNIRTAVIRAESKAKQEIAKERAAEAKKAKEEADRTKKAAAATPPKFSKIDPEGIVKGVIGGSTANKEGGAESKALTREEGDLVDAYLAMLSDHLKKALEQPPGLGDGLVAQAEFHLMADGSLTQGRILKSSGHADFDRAVLEAIRQTRMPERPKGVSEVQPVPFRTRGPDNN